MQNYLRQNNDNVRLTIIGFLKSPLGTEVASLTVIILSYKNKQLCFMTNDDTYSKLFILVLTHSK